ncbi:hypothetical protein ACWCQW_02320 [Streptomyces mirabilis]
MARLDESAATPEPVGLDAVYVERRRAWTPCGGMPSTGSGAPPTHPRAVRASVSLWCGGRPMPVAARPSDRAVKTPAFRRPHKRP